MITGNEPINEVKWADGSQMGEGPSTDEFIKGVRPYLGLTIHQYYTGLAMQALITKYGNESEVADYAIKQANNIIKALNKNETL